MQIKELLSESQGGIIKRWLEGVTSPNIFVKGNKPYTIAKVVQFPTKVPQLPIEELVNEIEAVSVKLGFALEDINLVNKQPTKQGAGVLVVMEDDKGNLYPQFKFFLRRAMTSIGMFWQTSDFAKETGFTWQETRKTGTGKNKATEVIQRINAKPIDTVTVNADIGLKQVPQVVGNTLKQKNPNEAKAFSTLAQYALQGNSAGVPGMASYERDIQVDFGEVATPLALASGRLAGGDYAAVESQLLKTLGVTWSSASKVFYPAALNEPLYDSILVWPNGTKLRISNKAKGSGGAASLVSLYEVIKKYPERFSPADLRKLNTTYKKYMKAVEVISTNNAIDGILELALAMGIIDVNEGEQVRTYVNQKIVSGTKGLTPRLKKILASVYKAKTDKPDYVVGYHLFASVAKLVAMSLNEDIPKSTEFFRFILSRANLIQVNQFTRRQGDAVGWEKFDVVWPPVFTGKIVFDVSNFQANKKPGGRLSFKT